MTKSLKPPVGYYGGKQRMRNWIAERIPYTSFYCEPYAGLGAVLVARKPSYCEMLNDASRAVMTWWAVVRDNPHLLIDKLVWTPTSRVVRNDARDICMEPSEHDDITVAWAFHVLCKQSMTSNIATTNGWRMRYARKAGTSVTLHHEDDILRIAERIRNVQLECSDAVNILERIARVRDASIYVDPPYRYATTTAYLCDDVDHDVLTDVLLRQRGRVAVSGYARDFPDLLDHGWHVSAFETKQTADLKTAQSLRVECLWTNYRIKGSYSK